MRSRPTPRRATGSATPSTTTCSMSCVPRRPPGSCPAERRPAAYRSVKEYAMADEPIIDRINHLAHEEEQLWQRASDGGGLTTDDQQRLKVIGVELDQCYDLLRQSQPRGEF